MTDRIATQGRDSETAATTAPRFHAIRESGEWAYPEFFTPDSVGPGALCWRYLDDLRVCILDRGHDNGTHEIAEDL